MAANASKVPFLRAVARRGFSANTCPRPIGQTAEVETTVLSNKVVIACADSTLPITRVSVVFRAGSRNESYENQGASHMMRIAAGMTTMKSTGFAITRNIQQIGGILSCTGDREIVSYTVEATANNIETGLRYLQDVIEPAFKPWELSDSIPRIRNQVEAVSPQVRAVELMHRAAFRSGLGNSIYIPKYQIGKISSESLLHYVASNCTADRCAVVGVGIDQNTLTGFTQCLELCPSSSSGGSGSSKSDAGNYYGGDARKETAGNMAHVAIGGLGGAMSNQKESLAFAVLQNAIGAAPATKYGSTSGSLGKAVTSAVGGASVSLSMVNKSYTDAGIFGAVVSADSRVIGKAVDAVMRTLKSCNVSSDDVNRAKNMVKAEVMESYATDGCLLAEMGMQAVLTKQVMSVDAIIAAIDAITQKDVQDAARKAGSSKLSWGAIGNLANVQYASDLA